MTDQIVQAVHSILIAALAVAVAYLVIEHRRPQRLLRALRRDRKRLERAMAALAHEGDCPDCREKPGTGGYTGTPGGARGRVIRISSASSPEDLAQKITDAIKTEMIRREEGL